jgi:hypothetical protein
MTYQNFSLDKVKRGEHGQLPRRRRLHRQRIPSDVSHVDVKQQQQRRRRQTIPKNWPPDFPPSDLDLVFSSSSSVTTTTTSTVAPPQDGTQTREVRCRGQDGEELPLRREKKILIFFFSISFPFLLPLLD